MEILTITGLVKDVVELFRKLKGDLDRGKRFHNNFFLKEVIEPIHVSMNLVHSIYVKAFTEAGAKFKSENGSNQELLKFLSDRDVETHVVRDDLQGLISAASRLDGLPRAVTEYLCDCRSYFTYVTDVGLRTPLRGLLEDLRQKDDILNFKSEHIDDLSQKVRLEMQTSCSAVLYEVRKKWPSISEGYYLAKLELKSNPRVYLSGIDGSKDEQV